MVNTPVVTSYMISQSWFFFHFFWWGSRRRKGEFFPLFCWKRLGKGKDVVADEFAVLLVLSPVENLESGNAGGIDDSDGLSGAIITKENQDVLAAFRPGGWVEEEHARLFGLAQRYAQGTERLGFRQFLKEGGAGDGKSEFHFE
jgi:hypothetical protein